MITTPGGGSIPVYVTTFGHGLEHLPAVSAAQLSYRTAPIANGRETLVTVSDFVSNDSSGSVFAIKGTVSTGPDATGTVLARAASSSGHEIRLTFVLDQP